MTAIREYGEGMPVAIEERGDRLVVTALNEAGHNGTAVDLQDIIDWVAEHRPDMIRKHHQVAPGLAYIEGSYPKPSMEPAMKKTLL